MEPARQTNALDRHSTGMSGQTTGMSQAVECGGEVGARGSKERSQVADWFYGRCARSQELSPFSKGVCSTQGIVALKDDGYSCHVS